MLDFLSYGSGMNDGEPSVGARIRALRQAVGLTQEQLATACGVTRSAVAQWETDRAGQLRGNISRIADALDTSVEHLLHGLRAEQEVTGDERALLRLYRLCSPEDRGFLLRTARRLAVIEAAPRA